jgi:hypothetical protein
VDAFQVRDITGSTNSLFTGTHTVPAGTWYHLAVVYSGTNAFIYVDGTLSGSSMNMLDSSTVNTMRQSSFFGMDQSGQYVANAKLDEIKVYNKALSQAQVQLDMATVGVPALLAGLC